MYGNKRISRKTYHSIGLNGLFFQKQFTWISVFSKILFRFTPLFKRNSAIRNPPTNLFIYKFLLNTYVLHIPRAMIDREKAEHPICRTEPLYSTFAGLIVVYKIPIWSHFDCLIASTRPSTIPIRDSFIRLVYDKDGKSDLYARASPTFCDVSQAWLQAAYDDLKPIMHPRKLQ